MDSPTPHIGQFGWPERSLRGLGWQAASQLLAQGSDVAVVLDGEGVVSDVAFADDDLAPQDWNAWVGRPWVDTVTVESRPKVEALLRDAGGETSPRWRQVNHPLHDGFDFPVRYFAVQVGPKGRIIALGRELRSEALLQQQLVETQRAIEKDYEHLRNAEKRYRILFHLAREPVLIISASDLKVRDANPAALALTGRTPEKLIGRSVLSLFLGADADVVRALFAETHKDRDARTAMARLSDGLAACRLTASLFRQERSAHYLLRLAEGDREGEPADNQGRTQMFDVLETLPDGFVVTDAQMRILGANAAFLDMIDAAAFEHIREEPLDQFFGRTGVDLGVLASKAREYGSVRNFSTILRGQYGSRLTVDVSAVVTAEDGADSHYGFAMRRQRGRDFGPPTAEAAAEGAVGPAAVEQLTQLVGRVSLKEIVRDTTDLIERMCIEAALDLTGDNRASAAEMLGLSRQGLYAKLHRYGLGARAGEE